MRGYSPSDNAIKLAANVAEYAHRARRYTEPGSARFAASTAVSFARLLEAVSDGNLREAQSALREDLATVEPSRGGDTFFAWLAPALNVINRELYRRYLRAGNPGVVEIHLGGVR